MVQGLGVFVFGVGGGSDSGLNNGCSVRSSRVFKHRGEFTL